MVLLLQKGPLLIMEYVLMTKKLNKATRRIMIHLIRNTGCSISFFLVDLGLY
jgi:hypothetical protein